ncbi:glycine-rich domain-containing protein [Jannaschia pohangensis]|uniref:Uncharacterized protein n=1 Tax=Jannaschia pohangensis TaxID=390807 RepID=A0A1I3V379_9RHOB|nr:hypothetical protein [Jannaschia pohangensis]SFJ90094.1 hypothetical protein SAMN04488095_0084 [Jannaschia pohangensis]
MQDPDLWHRIASHQFPDDSDGQSFVDQLRRDQGISRTTALRGIEEYRRFLYLAATGKGRTVPTRAVDAVWHLHLTHTRDYWEVFVPDVLGGDPVHHTPGKPRGHNADFERTLDRYREEFGEDPPKGIWTRRRMGHDLIGVVMAGGFALFWTWSAVMTGAPILFAAFGLTLAAFVLLAALAPTLADKGIHIGFGVDIWSDSAGGDCGSDGGGSCGD